MVSTLQTSPASIVPLSHVVLGRGDNASQIINLISPDRPDITEVTCELYVSGTCVQRKSASFVDEIVRAYTFTFAGLTEGIKYYYLFRVNGSVMYLGGELGEDDLTFTYWKTIESKDSLVLMSCNGVNDFKNAEKKWAMWERLEQEMLYGKRRPSLIVCGGDQYYQDAIEEKWIKRLTDADFPALRDEFKRDSLKNALSYWSHPSYRRLMAQIPSVAMLDDHDITDGAGGREEFFNGEEFKPEWVNYVSVQKEIFSLIQAPRNPTPINRKGLSAFSFIIDLGETALVALDLRTERNAAKKIVMSDESKKESLTAIENLPHKNVMILLPVVPIRNSIKIEGLALKAIKVAQALLEIKFLQKKSTIAKKIRDSLNKVTGLSDDLNDSLSSECNKGFFVDLLNAMAKGTRRGVNYSFLSGDIHTAGTVDLHVEIEEQKFHVPLLIASPIGYQPMYFWMESILREKKVIEFAEGVVMVKARNNYFTTNRNFILLYPNQLFKTPNECAYLYEEDVPGRMKLQTNSWETGEEKDEKIKKNVTKKPFGPEAGA